MTGQWWEYLAVFVASAALCVVLTPSVSVYAQDPDEEGLIFWGDEEEEEETAEDEFEDEEEYLDDEEYYDEEEEA